MEICEDDCHGSKGCRDCEHEDPIKKIEPKLKNKIIVSATASNSEFTAIKAQLEGNKKVFGKGKTAYAAVGAMIFAHQHEFNLTINDERFPGSRSRW